MTNKLIALFQILIALIIPVIIFLYWLAFGYGNHLENFITLLNYTF